MAALRPPMSKSVGQVVVGISTDALEWWPKVARRMAKYVGMAVYAR